MRPSFTQATKGPSPCAAEAAQHRLGLLHNRDDRDAARVLLGELRLIALEEFLKDHPCQRETLRAAHLRDIDNAQLALFKRTLQPGQQLAGRIVQGADDPDHVGPSGKRLRLLPLGLELEGIVE